jgi:hypothetical protein
VIGITWSVPEVLDDAVMERTFRARGVQPRDQIRCRTGGTSMPCCAAVPKEPPYLRSRSSKRPQLSPGPRCRADFLGGSHQKFGAMCQFKPPLTSLTWVVSSRPREIPRPPPRAGRSVPLTATVLLPKSR